jgi:uncharacterized protein
MSFYDRIRELQMLDKLYARSEGGHLFVLYGRRRVGKTELLNHWIGQTPKPNIVWTADRTSAVSQLRAFSQKVIAFAQPDQPASAQFSYDTWELALAELARLAQTQRIVVVMDEFTYAIESTPSLPSILQRMWDHQLKKTRIMLVLTGSHAGMIEREILSYRSPLYNRATDSLRLNSLPFGVTRKFLPNYSAEERMIVYGCMGGIPLYLEELDRDAPLDENLIRMLSRNIMLDDAGSLLRDQLSETRNYVAIIESIAASFTRLNEIATMSGLDQGTASKYLNVLQKLKIVERRVPATMSRPAESKQGRYHIIDTYLRFFYRFIAPQRSLIESGRLVQPMANLKQHLHEFVGKYAFEELCREWVLDQADMGKLGFIPRRVGSYWKHKGPEVDIMAINEDEHTILLGECKFTSGPITGRIVRGLVEKIDKVVPGDLKDWKVQLAFFSRSGFAHEAHEAVGSYDSSWINLDQLDAYYSLP